MGTTGINEDSDISYIAVASKEYAAGASAQITGWGLTNANNNAVPTQLQGATTVLVSNTDCAKTWGSRNLSDRMQCAGGQGINSGCMVTPVAHSPSEMDSSGTLSVTPHGDQASALSLCLPSGRRTPLSTAGFRDTLPKM